MKNVLVLLLLCISFPALSITYTSVSNGMWENPAAWANGISPGYTSYGDTVIVNSYMDIDSTLFFFSHSYLKVTSSGTLCGHWRVHFDQSNMDNYGNIQIDSLYMFSNSHGSGHPGANFIFHIIGYYTGTGTTFTNGGAAMAVGPDFTCYNELGITEADTKTSFSIYPNPSCGTFELDAPSDELLEIYDGNGQLVLTENVRSGHNTMNISELPAGFYSLRLTDGKKNSYAGIILEK